MLNITKSDTPTNKKPGTHFVSCIIEVWKNKVATDYAYPGNSSAEPIRITECESIDCTESFSSISEEMELSLPKGSIIRKSIYNAQKISDKAYDSVNISKSDCGVVDISVDGSKLATSADFSPGSRIHVYCGYIDPRMLYDGSYPIGKIYNDSKALETCKSKLSLVFDGFIVKCSNNTPLKISAEGMSSVLKKMSVKAMTSQKKSLSQFLTDIKFTEVTKFGISSRIADKIKNVFIPVTIKDGTTIYDVFSSYLKKYKLNSQIIQENSKYALNIGYSFNSGIVSEDEDEPCICDISKKYDVFCDYNVASDNLTMERSDEYYYVIKCNANLIGDKGKRKTYSFCVRLNPDLALGKEVKKDKYLIVFNKKSVTKDQRKQDKETGKSEVDTSNYKVIERTYPSPIPEKELNEKKLQAWAGAQLYDIMRNGVNGSLVLFGDFMMRSGCLINLFDTRNKNREGTYLVESVSTSLSLSGLRQSISIPYRITSSSETESMIEKYNQLVEKSISE